MATFGKNNNYTVQSAVPKKADIILRSEQEISAKQDELMNQSKLINSRIEAALDLLSRNVHDSDYLYKQNSEIFVRLKEENEALKQEFVYLAKQNENIYTALCEKLAAVSEEVKALSKKIEELPAKEEIAAARDEQPVIEEMVEVKPAEEKPAPVAPEIDYEKLAEIIARKLDRGNVDVDYDRIAAMLSMQECVSPDFIASKVAEQIVIPTEMTVTVDEESIAERIAEKIVIPAAVQPQSVETAEEVEAVETAEVAQPVTVGIDEDELADAIALKIGALKSDDFDIMVDDEGCASISKGIADNLNYDVISAAIAEKLRPAIELAIPEEPDYDDIAQRINEKINIPTVNEDAIADKAAAVLSNYLPDSDDLADKVTNSVIEAIPVQPAVDSGEISNAISERLIDFQATHDYDIVIDDEGITKITELVAEEIGKETGERFDKIDAEIENLKALLAAGAVAVTAGELAASQAAYDESYAEEEEATEETTEEVAVEEPAEEEAAEEVSEETVEEASEETAEEVAVEGTAEEETTEEVAEETDGEELVTVSDVVADGESAEENAEAAETEEAGELVTVSELTAEEEEAEEPATEEAEETLVTVSDLFSDEANGEETADEVVNEIDEQLSEGEIMPDGIAGTSGGVDFANMMKYNRSFIARIIQSTDEQKGYYGSVKQALLSYKKVNSNIAWGAERFNKGRETIAKFKIRGKTLCLYLALDPNEYKTSVYHHADVSDNKSMASTPMMVKIKSPLGVKKAIRLIDDLLAKRGGIKRNVPERDYAAMYPYETIEELIEDGLVKDVSKNK